MAILGVSQLYQEKWETEKYEVNSMHDNVDTVHCSIFLWDAIYIYSIYIYVYLYVYVYIYVYVCMYIYIYTYIHICDTHIIIFLSQHKPMNYPIE